MIFNIISSRGNMKIRRLNVRGFVRDRNPIGWSVNGRRRKDLIIADGRSYLATFERWKKRGYLDWAYNKCHYSNIMRQNELWIINSTQFDSRRKIVLELWKNKYKQNDHIRSAIDVII